MVAVPEHTRDLKPAIAGCPGLTVSVFSLAPLPLALHLGHAIGRVVPLETWQNRDRSAADWTWKGATGLGPVVEELAGDGPEAVITVSVTHLADADVVAAAPPGGMRASLTHPQPGSDVLGGHEDLALWAGAFRQALDGCKAARRIHLFYVGPTSLAVHLGAQVRPAVHPPVVVYQVRPACEPRYQAVFALQD